MDLTGLVLSITDAAFRIDSGRKGFAIIGKERVSGFPKDSLHIACISHKIRLQNILRAPGIEEIEKALLKQRLANLPAAQNGYIEKQKNALSKK